MPRAQQSKHIGLELEQKMRNKGNITTGPRGTKMISVPLRVPAGERHPEGLRSEPTLSTMPGFNRTSHHPMKPDKDVSGELKVNYHYH